MHACRWFMHAVVSASCPDVAVVSGTLSRLHPAMVSRAGDVWRHDVTVSFLGDTVTRVLGLSRVSGVIAVDNL